MIKEIHKRNWDYTLYIVDDYYVITVVFTGIVDYFKSFRLAEDEISLEDLDSLQNLSERIRQNYNEFKEQEIVPAIVKASL